MNLNEYLLIMNIIYGGYMIKNIISENPMRKLYITIKSNNLFMTEILDREIVDKNNKESETIKASLFTTRDSKHENILKIIDVKKSEKHYYVIMEYCNGGTLEENLNKYKIKYGKSFSEKIIQYIIRKIIDVMSYLQSKEVDNFNLSLKNIFLNYQTEEAKNNIDIIHSNIKLKLSKVSKLLFFERINEYNMYEYEDLKRNFSIEKLLIKEKIKKNKENEVSFYLLLNNLFNDNFKFREINEKEMQIFEFKISINLSFEAISFLINVLQIYSKERKITKNISELLKHPFLKNNVSNFSYFNKNIFANFIKEGYLVININNIDVINSMVNKQFK